MVYDIGCKHLKVQNLKVKNLKVFKCYNLTPGYYYLDNYSGTTNTVAIRRTGVVHIVHITDTAFTIYECSTGLLMSESGVISKFGASEMDTETINHDSDIHLTLLTDMMLKQTFEFEGDDIAAAYKTWKIESYNEKDTFYRIIDSTAKKYRRYSIQELYNLQNE